MKFSSFCFSCFCFSSGSSGFVFSSGSSGFVSPACVWESLRKGEMGEMSEGLGFGMDERGEGGVVVVVVGKVGVDVREDRADGEGVGGGEFSF